MKSKKRVKNLLITVVFCGGQVVAESYPINSRENSISNIEKFLRHRLLEIIGANRSSTVISHNVTFY